MVEVKLEPNWWVKYQLKDAPVAWMNPHFKYIWNHAPLDRQDVGKMSIGVHREFNTRKKIAKFNVLKDELERYDVYIPITAEQYVRGGQKAAQILASAVMEVFSFTGMYSKEKELENGVHVWKYVRDPDQPSR